MEQRKYFIYLYYWSDHSFYIGRTYEGSNRFGNGEKYQDQYVYKKMIAEEPQKVALFESKNPIIIYDLEQTFINQMILGDKNLNASKETNWFQTFMRTFAVKNIDISDLTDGIKDYWVGADQDKKNTINSIFKDIMKYLNKKLSLI